MLYFNAMQYDLNATLNNLSTEEGLQCNFLNLRDYNAMHALKNVYECMKDLFAIIKTCKYLMQCSKVTNAN